MRMTASWYRPLGRPNTSSGRATRARWRAPLGIVAVVDLNERGHGARVVPNERVWRCARSRQGQVAARWPSATLDSHSAQRPSKIRSGRGDVAGPIEQGDAHNTLDRNRPIQVPGSIPALVEQKPRENSPNFRSSQLTPPCQNHIFSCRVTACAWSNRRGTGAMDRGTTICFGTFSPARTLAAVSITSHPCRLKPPMIS